jgi:hypothetical protein
VGTSSRRVIILICLLAPFLGGCPLFQRGADPPALVVALGALMTEMVKRKQLKLFKRDATKKDPEEVTEAQANRGRNQMFFVVSRTMTSCIRDLSLQDEANRPALIARIVHEFEQVTSFIDTKIGTPDNPLTLFTSTNGAQHYDLGVLANASTLMTSAAQTKKEKEYKRRRWEYAWNICWRSTALHTQLWDESTGNLHQDRLEELLDRRIRAVETMVCTISEAGYMMGQKFAPAINTYLGGGWRDSMQTRGIEYPVFPATDDIVATIPPAQISTTSLDRTKDYYQSQGRLYYVRHYSRFNTTLEPRWAHDSSDYTRTYVGTDPQLAQSVALLVAGSLDVLDRNWMGCDLAASAVLLEALRFAMLRRSPFDDTAFTAIKASKTFMLGRPLAETAPITHADTLMFEGASGPHFRAASELMTDLQVGDCVAYYNSIIYRALRPEPSLWVYEQSIVSDAVATPHLSDWTQVLGRPAIELCGHGLKPATTEEFSNMFVYGLNGFLDEARKAVVEALAANGTILEVVFNAAIIKRWSPYTDQVYGPPDQTTDGQPSQMYDDHIHIVKPWWVVVAKSSYADVYSNAAQALAGIPATTRGDDGATSPLYDPISNYVTDPDDILFPLWEPSITMGEAQISGWEPYFVRRRSGSVGAKLHRTVIAASHVPGLWLSDPTELPILRPRVWPPSEEA